VNKFTITIQTLTPLWTGDVKRKCDTLKLTGLLGSLRWWFEALVRSIGYKACDSTGEKCELKLEKPTDLQDIMQKLCPACFLFGTTGWKKRFWVEEKKKELMEIPLIVFGTRKKRKGKYLSRTCRGIQGEIELYVHFNNSKKIYNFLLLETIKVVSQWGMLGAQIAQGNGTIFSKIHPQYTIHSFESLPKTRFQRHCENCPDFRNFKFLKFQITFKNDIKGIAKFIWRKNNDDNRKLSGNIKKLWENFGFLPIAFHLRDLLRQNLWRNNKDRRHKMLGKMGFGSRVFVSHAYKISDNTVEIRIFGYDFQKNEWENIKTSISNVSLLNQFLVNNNPLVAGVNIELETTGKEIIKSFLRSE